jgi:hypothetical protein
MIGDTGQDVGQPGLRIDIINLAVTIRLYIAAACCPSRAEPANSGGVANTPIHRHNRCAKAGTAREFLRIAEDRLAGVEKSLAEKEASIVARLIDGFRGLGGEREWRATRGPPRLTAQPEGAR